MNTQNFLVIFAFCMFFLGLYIGGSMDKDVDYEKRISEIVSCADYENEFLYTVGFSGREDCQKFNVELHDEYTKDCSSVIEKTSNASYNMTVLNACVYYSFEKARTSLNSKYYVFREFKRDTAGNNR